MKNRIGWMKHFFSKVFVLVLLLAFFAQAGTATPALPFNFDELKPQDLVGLIFHLYLVPEKLIAQRLGRVTENFAARRD